MRKQRECVQIGQGAKAKGRVHSIPVVSPFAVQASANRSYRAHKVGREENIDVKAEHGHDCAQRGKVDESSCRRVVDSEADSSLSLLVYMMHAARPTQNVARKKHATDLN